VKSIWKFQFRIHDRVDIEMPVGARVLAVQMQNDQPCLWALVDPKAVKESRVFRVFGTGHPVPDGLPMDFVGTFQMAGGALVWHLFESRETPHA